MVKYISSKEIYEVKKERSFAYSKEICLRKHQLMAIERFIDSQPKGAKIVELGVGGGHFSKLLLQKGFYRVSCVDVDNYTVYPELKNRFYKRDLSCQPLPFKNNSVDGVVAIEVIEHLDNLAFCFSQISRVLKLGGWFLITIPNISNLRRRIQFLIKGDGLLISEHNDHVQNITLSLMKKLTATYFPKSSTISLLKFRVLFPFLRFSIRHVDLFADNKIFIIRVPKNSK